MAHLGDLPLADCIQADRSSGPLKTLSDSRRFLCPATTGEESDPEPANQRDQAHGRGNATSDFRDSGTPSWSWHGSVQNLHQCDSRNGVR